MEKENREYKSSVFTDLFYDDERAKENEIALYNALHDEPLPKDVDIQKFRVENVLYMNFRNDISFGANIKILIFGEHQSTINYNMPLRSLLYVGRGYEQFLSVRERYQRQQILLPTPEFYTFYNGTRPFPRECILHLSDSFICKDNIMLDLQVKVININPQEKHPILERCKILKDYGIFVENVRKYQKENQSDGMKRAIESCIKQGILAEYLERKGSEVNNMLVAEYDYDLDIEVQREEARRLGREEGIEKGIASTVDILRQLGLNQDAIHKTIQEKFNLSPEAVKKYL